MPSEGKFVGPERPCQGVLLHGIDEPCPAENDAGLRTPKKLVSAKRDDVANASFPSTEGSSKPLSLPRSDKRPLPVSK